MTAAYIEGRRVKSSTVFAADTKDLLIYVHQYEDKLIIVVLSHKNLLRNLEKVWVHHYRVWFVVPKSMKLKNCDTIKVDKAKPKLAFQFYNQCQSNRIKYVTSFLFVLTPFVYYLNSVLLVQKLFNL